MTEKEEKTYPNNEYWYAVIAIRGREKQIADVVDTLRSAEEYIKTMKEQKTDARYVIKRSENRLTRRTDAE